MFVELIAPDPVGPELTRSIGIAIAVLERGRQETTPWERQVRQRDLRERRTLAHDLDSVLGQERALRRQ